MEDMFLYFTFSPHCVEHSSGLTQELSSNLTETLIKGVSNHFDLLTRVLV